MNFLGHPKIPTRNYRHFCSRSLLEGRAGIFVIFAWYYDDLINSFWIQLTFSDFKNFENSRPSASNFKRFQEYFVLTVVQKKIAKKCIFSPVSLFFQMAWHAQLECIIFPICRKCAYHLMKKCWMLNFKCWNFDFHIFVFQN